MNTTTNQTLNIPYKDGNILTLSLRNFQTFSYQTFTFGPALNLIAAPNGSGKSSVANAIAFLFNGTPKTIGKSKDILEYIKFGAEEAEIAADIWSGNKIIQFKRKIASKNFQYCINGERVTQKAYSEAVKALKIDVGSLCVFLPQERVGEFCKMTPVELFNEIIKDIDVDMTGIKNLYDRKVEIEGQLAADEEKKNILEAKLNELQRDLDENKEREEDIGKLEALRRRRDRIIFEELKEEYIKIRKAKKEAEDKVELFRKELEEMKEKLTECEKDKALVEYKKGVEVLEIQNGKLRELETVLRREIEKMEMRKNDKEKIGRRFKEKERELEEKKGIYCRREGEYKEAVGEVKRELDKFRESVIRTCELPELSGLVRVDKDLELRSAEDAEAFLPSLDLIEKKIQNCGLEAFRIRSVSKGVQDKLESLEKQLKLHGDQGSLRMDRLRDYHLPSHKAVIWLRENKGLFKDEILEPLYLHIQIEKPFIQYVEPFLGFQAISSFIVKNEDDFALFTEILKDKQGLPVNVAMDSPCRLKGISRELLAKYSLDGVLTDFIQCREEYLRFLNNYGHFNMIPISTKEIDEETIFNNIPECRRMAVGERYAERKMSKYDGDFTTITSRLRNTRLFDLPSVDTKRIIEEMEELKKERERNRMKVEGALKEKESLESMKVRLKKGFETGGIDKAVFVQKRIESSLNQLRREIEEIKNMDYEGILRNKDRELEEGIEEVKRIFMEIEELLDIENIPVFELEKAKSQKLEIDNFVKKIHYYSEAKKEEEGNIKDFDKRMEEMKGGLRELNQRLRQGGDCKAEGDIEEICAQIAFLESKLKITEDKSKAKNDFSQKLNLFQCINSNLETLCMNKEQVHFRYSREKEILLSKIDEKISKLSSIFSSLFDSYGYSGSLQLNTDTRDWELSILVKFRENEAFQKLSSFRQSGGEKSLTTALFLLSLAQCEDAPFRLVDEINQGMDAINERKLFGVLREMGKMSQIFIITPKLIDGLEFLEGTRAIVIYGGSGITKDLENYSRSVLSSI